MQIVTPNEKRAAFIRATQNMNGAAVRWAQRVKRGLNDEELAEALRYEIGIAGGSCGPDQISINYQSGGLKIWMSWEGIAHREMRPTFEGRSTIAMAREVYGVSDPSDDQLGLF